MDNWHSIKLLTVIPLFTVRIITNNTDKGNVLFCFSCGCWEKSIFYYKNSFDEVSKNEEPYEWLTVKIICLIPFLLAHDLFVGLCGGSMSAVRIVGWKKLYHAFVSTVRREAVHMAAVETLEAISSLESQCLFSITSSNTHLFICDVFCLLLRSIW
jgi:hypothetical protein